MLTQIFIVIDLIIYIYTVSSQITDICYSKFTKWFQYKISFTNKYLIFYFQPFVNSKCLFKAMYYVFKLIE